MILKKCYSIESGGFLVRQLADEEYHPITGSCN